MYNSKSNIITGSLSWGRSMNLRDLILEMFGKRIAK